MTKFEHFPPFILNFDRERWRDRPIFYLPKVPYESVRRKEKIGHVKIMTLAVLK